MKRILAMVLAGGRVNELQVLTLNRPKSALPFGGMYRIIDFPFSNLMHSGIERVGVLSQYHSASLVRHVGIGNSWDMVGHDRGAIVLPPFKAAGNSDWYKGTADAIFQNLEFIDEFNPDLVLILSGDHIYNMDYTELVDYHLAKQADVTAVFKEVPIESAHRFGVADIDNEDGNIGGKIIQYQEKPQNPSSLWASLTIYLFNTDTLKEILHNYAETSESCEFGRDILTEIPNTHRVYGYKYYGYWAYTQTLTEYWQANMDLLGQNPIINLNKWQVRTNLDHRNLRDRIPTIVTENAKIENSLVYNGCIIEGHVSNCIIFPGVIIRSGVNISNSIVMFDTLVNKNCTINKTIFDTDIVVGENSRIGVDDVKIDEHNLNILFGEDGITVVGQSTLIPSNQIIGKNIIVNSPETIL